MYVPDAVLAEIRTYLELEPAWTLRVQIGGGVSVELRIDDEHGRPRGAIRLSRNVFEDAKSRGHGWPIHVMRPQLVAERFRNQLMRGLLEPLLVHY